MQICPPHGASLCWTCWRPYLARCVVEVEGRDETQDGIGRLRRDVGPRGGGEGGGVAVERATTCLLGEGGRRAGEPAPEQAAREGAETHEPLVLGCSVAAKN